MLIQSIGAKVMGKPYCENLLKFVLKEDTNDCNGGYWIGIRVRSIFINPLELSRSTNGLSLEYLGVHWKNSPPTHLEHRLHQIDSRFIS